ncbi:hypothetical protein Hanom_Chr08g00708381 [Helianthus anomalus]
MGYQTSCRPSSTNHRVRMVIWRNCNFWHRALLTQLLLIPCSSVLLSIILYIYC